MSVFVSKKLEEVSWNSPVKLTSISRVQELSMSLYQLWRIRLRGADHNQFHCWICPEIYIRVNYERGETMFITTTIIVTSFWEQWVFKTTMETIGNGHVPFGWGQGTSSNNGYRSGWREKQCLASTEYFPWPWPTVGPVSGFFSLCCHLLEARVEHNATRGRHLPGSRDPFKHQPFTMATWAI